jgi:hypothetical protein
MKVAIMQPYFFPYIGYFQLISAVDKFVIYDNIEYTKKGWINRNRILKEGADLMISLPLKKDSDFLFVNQRYLAEDWSKSKQKLINSIKESYRKAPHFEDTFNLVQEIFNYSNSNLFEFILHSVQQTCKFIGIETEIIVSSTLDYNNELKSEEKVIAICKSIEATQYINSIGGVELYNKNNFSDQGIQLNFIKSNPIIYNQFKNEFVPWLSIIDIMMFNSKETVSNFLNQTEIL